MVLIFGNYQTKILVANCSRWRWRQAVCGIFFSVFFYASTYINIRQNDFFSFL